MSYDYVYRIETHEIFDIIVRLMDGNGVIEGWDDFDNLMILNKFISTTSTPFSSRTIAAIKAFLIDNKFGIDRIIKWSLISEPDEIEELEFTISFDNEDAAVKWKFGWVDEDC